MAFAAIYFSVDRRQKLATILQFVSWACVICGIVLVSLGTFISLHVQAKVSLIIRLGLFNHILLLPQQINLMEGYDSSMLPKVLIIVGSLVVLLDLVCGKICQDISDHRRLHRYEMLLFPLVIILFVLDVCLLTAGCMCFSHRAKLSHSINDGLWNGMIKYKDNITFKYEIDGLQMEFECCGNNGYEDWFNMQWISTQFLDIDDKEIQSKMTTGYYLNDDVPFSCCVAKTTRACIHHHVTKSDLHFNYRFPADITIYPVGCRDKLIDYFSIKLKNIGTVGLAVFGLQFINVICLRYLQTSIANASKTGNPKADAWGFLFDKDAGKNDDTTGDDAALLQAQHQQQQDSSNSDDFTSDQFSSDDDDFGGGVGGIVGDIVGGGGGGGGGFDPIYENLPLLGGDMPQQDKHKSKKDGTDNKTDKSSKKQKESQKTKKNEPSSPKKNKTDSSKNKSPSSKTNKSSPSKKDQHSGSKKNKSPSSTKKSPVSTKKKSPMSSTKNKSMKKPSPGKTGSKKVGGKGKGKMPGKKMGKGKKMNKNRHNNCGYLSWTTSSSSCFTSDDEFEPGVYYINETF
ncbi:photoreceptor outer segment membrane glycoprotein 2-like [Antedon mediterranea]|uniref:photoreceptor outer segment membrane glycoprotein 2-like n=1 Tax=Antedon mediterranea TaxID=105859 RepID=UPI003AF40D63